MMLVAMPSVIRVENSICAFKEICPSFGTCVLYIYIYRLFL